ncbi:MAG: hypothetical protein KDD43_00250 [Bdellovibrionales bacterium]|nr:hypothetical protein [Bdellovibrionales bacterium]
MTSDHSSAVAYLFHIVMCKIQRNLQEAIEGSDWTGVHRVKVQVDDALGAEKHAPIIRATIKRMGEERFLIDGLKEILDGHTKSEDSRDLLQKMTHLVETAKKRGGVN